MAAVASSSSTSGSPGGGGVRPTTAYRSRFGDTTLTKVFVGGLAWETPSEGLRRHFEQYGDILEAVVIADRLTGRSKGYGFVTFREPEAAQRAVQDPNPMIAGRRANCNIASLGPPRPAQPPRGRASPGAHFQAPQPAPPGPPYIAGGAPPPGQMMPQHGPAIYPSQYGYWYPLDYQYQQALMNPQVMQSYYALQAQLYGLTSPTAPPPYHQYAGYMPALPSPAPRAVIQPAQQVTGPPFVQHPTAAAQIQGSFVPLPSLPQNFMLNLPPNAMSILSPSATALRPADLQAASAAATGATNANSTQGA